MFAGAPVSGQEARLRLDSVKPGRTWLVYTLIRLGIFAVVLAVLLALQIEQWIAAVIAALIALCVSIIFLRRPREAASQTLYEARSNRNKAASPAPTGRTEDEDVEDQAVDRVGSGTPASPATSAPTTSSATSEGSPDADTLPEQTAVDPASDETATATRSGRTSGAE